MINEMNTFLKQGIYEKDSIEDITRRLVSMMMPEEKKSRAPQAAGGPPSFAQIVR
jgi:hypothetical protein